MVVMVTGKKAAEGVQECSRDTISESFDVEFDQAAVRMFERNNPGYTAVAVKLLEPSKLKKYTITCNEGSLEGMGTFSREIQTVVFAESERGARIKFGQSMLNQVYGRRIIAIRESV